PTDDVAAGIPGPELAVGPAVGREGGGVEPMIDAPLRAGEVGVVEQVGSRIAAGDGASDRHRAGRARTRHEQAAHLPVAEDGLEQAPAATGAGAAPLAVRQVVD